MTDIMSLSDEAVERIADLDPMAATSMGLPGRDHLWPDLSPDGTAEQRRVFVDLRDRARATSAVDRQQDAARRVLLNALDESIEEIDAGLPFQDLNNIASPHQSIRDTFDLMARGTRDEWGRIIVRLETIDQPLAGYRASLDEGRRRQMLAARRQVETAIEQGQVVTGPESGFGQLLVDFDEAEVGDEGMRTRLQAAIGHAQDSFAELSAWLRDSYLADAPVADGVGADRYIAAARRFLGTTIDPQETYAWGWQEIQSLWSRLEEVCRQIDPDRTVGEVAELLQTDPARAATSQEEFVELMTARQLSALEQLDGVHFDVPEPIRRIDVKVSPPGGALAAYYTGPSEDFIRPGTVWYPVAGRSFFPLFEEITTAYHEGFPGHHLQIGVQTALAAELSRFHRLVVWYSGSGEGWALYAERLMAELGYHEKPDYEAGWLAGQLLRACRIAIDIGCHLDLPIPPDVDFHPGERWSFALARELLVTRALQADDMATSEVVRYLGWPGQAISYKVGEEAILDLRRELVAKGGMELRAFHTRVLEAGAVGIDVLRDLVRRT